MKKSAISRFIKIEDTDGIWNWINPTQILLITESDYNRDSLLIYISGEDSICVLKTEAVIAGLMSEDDLVDDREPYDALAQAFKDAAPRLRALEKEHRERKGLPPLDDE